VAYIHDLIYAERHDDKGHCDGMEARFMRQRAKCLVDYVSQPHQSLNDVENEDEGDGCQVQDEDDEDEDASS